MSKFYTYRQNNSGGCFDFNYEKGITVNVIIEADSPENADDRAKEIGLYFDGCDDWTDCPCCGDRWYHTYEGAGTESPEVYGKPVAEAEYLVTWAEPGKEAAVHYLDGTIKWYGERS
jgi:hypothetical protein